MLLTGTSGLSVANVFAATAYTGDGAAGHVITTGLDYSTAGGLIWAKSRSGAFSHGLNDTVRGITERLYSSGPDAADSSANYISSVSSTGFTLGSGSGTNGNGETNVAWSFLKSASFFDIVTFTGDGDTSSRHISHSLRSVPGWIIIKKRSASGNWITLAQISSTVYGNVYLNTTAANQTGNSGTITSVATSTYVDVGWIAGNLDGNANVNGATYVVYLFANDTTASGLVQCGIYTGDGTGDNSKAITLGWQPQFLIIKRMSGGTGAWAMFDATRGLVSGNDAILYANTSDAEYGGSNWVAPTSTGFTISLFTSTLNTSGSDYVYLAIRAP